VGRDHRHAHNLDSVPLTLTIASSASGLEIRSEDIGQWLLSDELDRGHSQIDDDAIVTVVLAKAHDEDSQGSIKNDTADTSHGNAFMMLSDCLKWLQQQDEANSYNVACLHSLFT
jgi:hypothetical protein